MRVARGLGRLPLLLRQGPLLPLPLRPVLVLALALVLAALVSVWLLVLWVPCTPRPPSTPGLLPCRVPQAPAPTAHPCPVIARRSFATGSTHTTRQLCATTRQASL